MNPALYGIIFASALFGGTLFLIDLGRRIGASRIATEGEAAFKGFGAIEGAVFGLLGLVLAFSFSGALTRFDGRRHLMIEESNAIGTAWLRIDLLPPDDQPAMRDLFRRYVDSRIDTYRKLPDVDAARMELAKSASFQKEIWTLAVTSTQKSGAPHGPILLFPALNAMIDITTAQTEAVRIHPPPVIFAMLAVLTLACSLFAGYDMASRPRLNLLHSLAFALVLSVSVYVIIDLEYPRLGLIRMSDSDQVLVDLRASMK